MAAKQAKSKHNTARSSDVLPDDRFINRELSWLEFNQRVLEQADDESIPLLERAKFLAITSSNLDEFMMVRVGSLKLQQQQNAMVRDPSGLTVAEQLGAISAKSTIMVAKQYKVLRECLEPKLSAAGIDRIDLHDCHDRCRQAADKRFHEDAMAVLSPQVIHDDGPFPLLQGLAIHLCVRLRPLPDSSSDPNEQPDWEFAVVPLGRTVPRLLPMPSEGGHAYALLEDLVAYHIGDFFPGREVVECIAFRITRNADVQLREDEAPDLMLGMEEVLESRRLSRVVRLEFTSGASDPMLAFLSEKMQLVSQDLHAIDGPLDLTYLFSLHGLSGFDSLRDDPWPAQSTPGIDPAESMLTTIAQGDLLMIHPYESYDPVVRMIEEAAIDPDVLAIKQILYRTSRNSPIVAALMRAAERGKYVSVIVELKARFDEARNIEWAREMERAGVQVIYGIRGLKTHAKVCIIVRREPQGIVRYMHFGTGNYNEVTANLYSDVSLLTCDDGLGADATAFFNGVTGNSELQSLAHLAVAPATLRNRIMDLIDTETRRCEQGQKAEIQVKLNALVDTEIIDALYRASQAGVQIDLNIRGVCCLKPGIPGVSDTIRVVSIVDRYLEHARILYFRHGGDHQFFISSADWMPRNLDRRIELLIPIEDEDGQKRLRRLLKTYFQDDTNAWLMQLDGQYRRLRPNGPPRRSQYLCYQQACAAIRDSNQDRRRRFEPHVPSEH